MGKATIDAENWYEGWRSSKACVRPLLLHPVKADTCGRFSTNGYGRGCWRRQVQPGHEAGHEAGQVSGGTSRGIRTTGTNVGTHARFVDELRNDSKSDLKTSDAGFVVPMRPAQL